MIEYKYENSTGFESKKKSELGFIAVERYAFEGEVYQLREYFKNNYATYQLSENVVHGEHDLFYWSNSNNYFTLNINTEKLNKEQIETIHNDLMNKLENEFSNLNLFVRVVNDYILEPVKVENFIMNYNFNLDNLEIEKFSVITPNSVSFPNINDNVKARLRELNEQFLQAVKGKKAIINNDLEGSFKPLEDSIVFFKKRVRKSYYNIKLNNINSIQFL